MNGPSETERMLASVLEQQSAVWIESWHNEKIDHWALAETIHRFYKELE